MTGLHTIDPVALRYLMSETVFDIEGNHVTGGAPDLPFYGKNQRHILFLTADEHHRWMSAPAMDAFIKTLAALKMTVDDVAVLNLAMLPETPSTNSLSAFFKPKVVVSLGASFLWQGQVGIPALQTHSFDELLADAGKKRDFWIKIKMLLG